MNTTHALRALAAAALLFASGCIVEPDPTSAPSVCESMGRAPVDFSVPLSDCAVYRGEFAAAKVDSALIPCMPNDAETVRELRVERTPGVGHDQWINFSGRVDAVEACN